MLERSGLVATQAALVSLCGGKFGKTDDLADVPATFYVRRTRPMTSLARMGFACALQLEHALRVRRPVDGFEFLFVAGLAGVRAHISGRACRSIAGCLRLWFFP